MFGGGGGFGTGTFGTSQQNNTPPTGMFGQSQQASQQTGFGFGSTTPAFGTSSAPSTFGAPASSTPFGVPPQQPAFNSFGQQRPAFGAPGTSIFPSTSQPPSASTGFGGGFGQQTSTFGQPAASSNLFGSTKPAANVFGSTSSAPSAFGTQGLGGFGQASTTFGATSQAPSMYGATGTQQQTTMNQGTGQPPFTPTHDRDASTPASAMNIFQTITAMPAYRGFSIEELRFQDYQMGKKFGNQGGFGTTPAFGTASSSTGAFGSITTPAFGNAGAHSTSGIFGSTAPTQPTLFGQQSTGFNSFGQQQPATSQPSSIFGGTNTAFGPSQASSTAFGLGSAQQSGTSAFTGFGKPTMAPAFGTGFGQTASTSQPAFGFGAPTSQPPAFSAAPPTGIFGGTSTNIFGSSQPANGSLFGQPKPPATTGLFGQLPTSNSSTFGATPAAGGLFSQQPGTGSIFGKPITSPFGVPTSAPPSSAAPGGIFGNAPAPTSGFGAQQAPLFSSAPTAPAFGATPAATSTFGTASGAFGTGAGAFGNPLFGQQQKPVIAPFSQAPTSTVFGGPGSSTQPFSVAAPVGTAGFGMSPLSGGLGSSFGAQPFGQSSAAIPQPQQPLYATQDMPPWGDNPVFDKSKEEVKKSVRVEGFTPLPLPGETPQKPALLPFVKLNPRISAPSKLRAYPPAVSRILSSSPGASIFDGTAKDDIILGLDKRYTPRKNLKKLVVTPDSAGSDIASTPKLIDSTKKKVTVTFDENLERAASERGSGRRFVNVSDKEEPETPIVKKNKGNLPVTVANGNTTPSDLGTPPGSIESQSPEKSLPGRNEYILSPSVPTLLAMTDQQLQSVKNFTIKHPEYGSITFAVPVDLLSASPTGTREGIRLIPDAIVQISRKNVTVYPDETLKPEVGRGLNVAAIIELENCWPIDKKSGTIIKDVKDPRWHRHMSKLENMPDTEFLGFHKERGTWQFRVEHFSGYGLDEDTEDEDGTNTSTTTIGEDEIIEEFQDTENFDEDDAGEEASQTTSGEEVEESDNDEQEDSLAEDSFQHVARHITPSPGHFKDMRSGTILGSGTSNFQSPSTSTPSSNGTPLPSRFMSNIPASVDLPNLSAQIGYLQSARKRSHPSPPKAVKSADFKDAKAVLPELLSHTDYYDDVVNKYRRLGTIGGVPLRKSIVHRKEHLIVDAGLSVGRSFRIGWGPGGQMAVLSGNIGSGNSPNRSGSLSFVTIKKVKIFGNESESVLEVERKRHEKTLSAMLDCTEMIPTIAGAVPFEEQDTDEIPDIEMFQDDIAASTMSTPTPRAQVNENLTFESLYDACMAAQLLLPPPSEVDKTSPAGVRNLLKDEMKIWRLASALWDDIIVHRISRSGFELTDQQVKVIEGGIRKERVSAWLRHAIKESEANNVNRLEGAKAVFDLLIARNIAKAVEVCLASRNFRLSSILAQIGGASARVLVSSSSSNNSTLPPSSGHKAPGRGGTDDDVRQRVKDQVALMKQEIGKIDRDLLDIWVLASGEMDEWNAAFYSKCKCWRTTFGLFLWYAKGGWSRVDESVVTYEEAIRAASRSRSVQALATPIPAYVERGYNIDHINDEIGDGLAWLLLKLDADPEMTLDEILSPYGLAPRPLDLRVAFILSVVLMYAKAIRDGNKAPSSMTLYPQFTFSDTTLFELDNYLSKDSTTDVVTTKDVLSGSRKFDELVSSLSFALESLGLWRWAIYVFCFASYREAREGRIRQLLERYYPVYDVSNSCWNTVKNGIILKNESSSAHMDVDTFGAPVGASEQEDENDQGWSFLVDKLKVPARWIHEAKALGARYRGEKLREAIYLIDAQHYSAAHRLIIVDIAPDFLLEGDYLRLGALLSQIPSDAAEYWLRGGGLILLYLEAIETLPALVERGLSCTNALTHNNISMSSSHSPNLSTSNVEHLVVAHRRARQELEERIPKVREMLDQFKTLGGLTNGLLGGGLAWMDSFIVGNVGMNGAIKVETLHQNDAILNGRLCVAQMASKVVDWAEKIQIVTSKKILTAQDLGSLPLSEDHRLLRIQTVSSEWYKETLHSSSYV